MATYTELTTLIPQYANRVGFTEYTDQMGQFIETAQRRIQRQLRIPPMLTVDSSFTIDSETETIPSDLLEVKEFLITQGGCKTQLREAPIRDVLQFSTNGTPEVYTQVGSNFYFGPTPDSAHTGTLVYYKEIPFVSSSNPTNWFSTYAPELIIYGALLEGAIFLHDDARIQLFSEKFNDHLTRIEQQDKKERWKSEGRIRNYPLSLTGEP